MRNKVLNKRNKSSATYISWILIAQSLSIIGFLSTRKFPNLVRIVGNDLEAPVFRGSEITAIIASTVILITARGIGLGRSRAWTTAVTLQSFLILNSIFHAISQFVLKHSNAEVALRSLGISHLISEMAILAILIHFKSDFRTKSDNQTLARAILLTFRITLITSLVAVAFVAFDRRSFVVLPNFYQILEVAFKGLLGISSSIQYVSERAQLRTELTLAALGLLIAITSTLQFLRPNIYRHKIDLESQNLVRDLLQKYPDHDSLSYFALRNEKNFIWSKNRKAVIPYSVVNGVMITTGDPIGDTESWPAAMAAYCAEAELHAWIPAVYGCSEEAGLIWVRETGFESLEIGDEAVVVAENFSLEGPEMKKVRQMVNQAKRKNYISEVRKISEIDKSDLDNLRNLANVWRRGGDERGFSMALGRFGDSSDPEIVISVAKQDGEIKGFLQFVPWGSQGLSLDSMRRSPDAESGINELLISATIEYAKNQNISEISLNFATFRSVFEKGERLGAGPIIRITYKTLIFLSKYFQMESLYRFNSKFRPIWKSRYVLFPGVGKLIRVSVAILMIESFLPKIKLTKSKKPGELIAST